MSHAIAIVDDDPVLLQLLSRIFERAGIESACFERPEDLIEAVDADANRFDAVLTDLNMPTMDGLGLLAVLRERHRDLPVVLMTGDATVDSAVQAMKNGAFDYLRKPLPKPDEVIARLERAFEQRRLRQRNRILEHTLDVTDRFPGIVGDSPRMREVLRLVESVAPSDATVLVLGPSGTGKELVARAIHERSARASRPFLAVNCSTLTDTLLESELFGHVKGAFTGATSTRRGLLEEASGGTLFLDEVGDMPLGTQARFLRVLQEGEIKPLGSNEMRHVDVRVVAATNVDLRDAIRRKQFREDLFYRLNVFAVEIPPLCERRRDVPLLAHHFLNRYARQLGKPVPELDAPVLDRLSAYDWPGNIRELENAIHRLVLLDRSGRIGMEGIAFLTGRDEPPREADTTELLDFPRAKEVAMGDFERRYLLAVLARANGAPAEAARLAGLDRSNFRRLLKRHGLQPGAVTRPG